jgi:hypothetical protein
MDAPNYGGSPDAAHCRLLLLAPAACCLLRRDFRTGALQMRKMPSTKQEKVPKACGTYPQADFQPIAALSLKVFLSKWRRTDTPRFFSADASSWRNPHHASVGTRKGVAKGHTFASMLRRKRPSTMERGDRANVGCLFYTADLNTYSILHKLEEILSTHSLIEIVEVRSFKGIFSSGVLPSDGPCLHERMHFRQTHLEVHLLAGKRSKPCSLSSCADC